MAGNDALVLNEQHIAEDPYGYVSLTDMWIAAGRPTSLTPARWQKNPGPKRLIKAFEEKVGKSYLKENSATGSCLYTKKGRGGVTFAHASIALTFAKALSPELELAVNELFLRYKADAVSLAVEILDGLTGQAEYDELRVKLRELVKEHNKLSAGAALSAGVKNFEAYNGAGLKGLYGMNKGAAPLQEGAAGGRSPPGIRRPRRTRRELLQGHAGDGSSRSRRQKRHQGTSPCEQGP